MPEPFDGLVVNPVARFAKQNPSQFAILKPRVEGFEPGKLLDHGGGDPGGFVLGDNLDIIRHKAQQPLLCEATGQLAHGFWMRGRLVRALPDRGLWSGAVLEQDQGADELIAPLDLIRDAQLPLRKIRCDFHVGPLPWHAQGSAREGPRRVGGLPRHATVLRFGSVSTLVV